MNEIEIFLDEDRRAFRPGDSLAGRVRWQLASMPKSLEVRLLWYTEGKGDQDVGLVESQPCPGAGRSGEHAFRFVLPAGPYSFSGQLISLLWAVEAVSEPGDHTTRVEVVVSPTGEELRLGSAVATSG